MTRRNEPRTGKTVSDEELTPEQKKKLRDALRAEAVGDKLPKRSERLSGLKKIQSRIEKNGGNPKDE